jgi:hypothetical protein
MRRSATRAIAWNPGILLADPHVAAVRALQCWSSPLRGAVGDDASTHAHRVERVAVSRAVRRSPITSTVATTARPRRPRRRVRQAAPRPSWPARSTRLDRRGHAGRAPQLPGRKIRQQPHDAASIPGAPGAETTAGTIRADFRSEVIGWSKTGFGEGRSLATSHVAGPIPEPSKTLRPQTRTVERYRVALVEDRAPPELAALCHVEPCIRTGQYIPSCAGGVT